MFQNTPTKEAPVPPCTDSDVENTKPIFNTANITRKLTRSASARKSIHVVGKATNSDSDSDVEIGPSKRYTFFKTDNNLNHCYFLIPFITILSYFDAMFYITMCR